jgi:predicted transcriptional regulator of viral defense system
MEQEQNYKIRDWVEDLPKKGVITFSIEEVYKLFPAISKRGIASALLRLTTKGKILSAWKGFYVIIPIEYAHKGIVPPVVYINQLMEYLKRSYYIGLLDAAAFYAAAHQRPQIFTVVTGLPSVRASEKKGVKVKFITKKNIPTSLLVQKKTKSGYVFVSSPELTALDLILYEKEIGGLNRAATVLNELAEELNFQKVTASLFDNTPVAVIQRLGYLLEVLDYMELADDLLRKIKEAGIAFRKTALKAGKDSEDCDYNAKWKIIINEEIEIDE